MEVPSGTSNPIARHEFFSFTFVKDLKQWMHLQLRLSTYGVNYLTQWVKYVGGRCSVGKVVLHLLISSKTVIIIEILALNSSSFGTKRVDV